MIKTDSTAVTSLHKTLVSDQRPFPYANPNHLATVHYNYGCGPLKPVTVFIFFLIAVNTVDTFGGIY